MTRGRSSLSAAGNVHRVSAETPCAGLHKRFRADVTRAGPQRWQQMTQQSAGARVTRPLNCETPVRSADGEVLWPVRAGEWQADHVEHASSGQRECGPGMSIVVAAQQQLGPVRPAGSRRHHRYNDRTSRAAARVLSPADRPPVHQTYRGRCIRCRVPLRIDARIGPVEPCLEVHRHGSMIGRKVHCQAGT